jgi:hypothetical protein
MIDEYSGDRSRKDLTRWITEISKSATLQPMSKQHTGRAPAEHESAAAKTKDATTPAKKQDGQSGSILPDLHLTDWTDWQQIKALLFSILDVPLLLFSAHPYMLLLVVWSIGLFQGLFFGILFAVRDKR